MNCTIRLVEELVAAVTSDLRRSHPFAYERVGFLHARVARVGHRQDRAGCEASERYDAAGVTVGRGEKAGWGWIVLPVEYVPVRDDRYMPDDEVGARIDGAAVREQMQAALTLGVSVLHVHLHEHDGMPGFSPTDMEGLPRVLRALHDAAPDVPHAALILSRDSACSVAICPRSNGVLVNANVTVIGRPMRFAWAEEHRHG